MKKFISIVLVLLLTLTMLSTVVFAEAKTAKAVKGSPAVDGNIDVLWNDAPVFTDYVQTGAKVMGTETEIKPSFRVMWDDKNLYVLTEVKDSTVGGIIKNPEDLCNNDGVEIYIDQNNAKKLGSYEDDDIWLKVDYQGVIQDSNTSHAKNIPSGTKAVAKITKDGYRIEVSVPWTAIKPAKGMVVGFELSWSDNTTGGEVRTSWLHWQDTSNQTYKNPKSFGNLELTEVTKTNTPVPASNTPTPKAVGTVKPTSTPTTKATTKPTNTPAAMPTAALTTEPAVDTTAEPTTEPTTGPTAEPTAEPTTESTVEGTTESAAESTTEATSVAAETTDDASGDAQNPAGSNVWIYIVVAVGVVISLFVIFRKKLMPKK